MKLEPLPKTEVEARSTEIHPDLPCWSVKETNDFVHGLGLSERRVQVLRVWIDDHLRETFPLDLGPADAFPGLEFNLMGGVRDPHSNEPVILETVGRMLEQAEHLRMMPPSETTLFEREHAADIMLDRFQKALSKGEANGN